jgi:hypothetical protein
MHPERELNRLAMLKAARQRGIAYHRAHCAAAATRVLQPLAWVDHKLALWRQYSPWMKFLAVPLGLLLKKAAPPRVRWASRLLRWAPLVLGVVRGFTGARRSGTAAE